MASYYRPKTAAGNTLLMAKAAWAKSVADLAADRFKSYGGWARQRTTSTVRMGSSGLVELTTRSEAFGWTGFATFDMEKQVVSAMVQVDRKPGEDQDFLKDLMRMSEDQKVIPIGDHDSPDKVVEAISLWWSRAINPLTERG